MKTTDSSIKTIDGLSKFLPLTFSTNVLVQKKKYNFLQKVISGSINHARGISVRVYDIFINICVQIAYL